MFNRVTNSGMTNLFLNDIRRTLNTITDLQHQISTGKKLSNPSDDPIAADRILDYRQTLDKMSQYVDNIDQADSLANNVDGALSTMEDVMLRARDLAIKASNEAPNNQQPRDAIAKEINSLIDELITQSNQKYDGKTLFAGFKTDTLPFTSSNELQFVAKPGAATSTLAMPKFTIDGNTRTTQAITDSGSVKDVLVYDTATAAWVSVFSAPYNATGITSDAANNTFTVNGAASNPFADGTQVRVVFDKTVAVKYNGDTGVRDAQIGDGSRIETAFAGATSNDSAQKSIFGKYSSDQTEAGTAEAFQYLFDLRDSIFKYPNATAGTGMAGIQAGITDIDKVRQNISDMRAEQGGKVNRLEMAKNRLKNMEIDTKSLLSKQEDVDMTEALSNMVLQQNIYQASLGVGAKIIQTTLLDFLR